MPDERVWSMRDSGFAGVLVSAVAPEDFVSEASPQPQPPVSPAQTHAEPDAQTRFVQQNLRRIFLLIYRIVGNVDDAQDLTQETFIKALQRQGQLKDLEKASHWLSRIASNTAIDFLRRNKKFAFVDVTQVAETASSTLESPEQHLLRGERKLHLDGGLAVLTERERMAILLRDVEDMPAEQVALQMNCSMATVRSHIANARIKFKRYLESRKSL
ncbi:MAG TPA: sigma-70 family RNA polymerase sigma factor [Bryobacteraceae bacterium]|nr:sigma-70 family RNA polymerase sigma factor [Bryobacteraceae bacterium]